MTPVEKQELRKWRHNAPGYIASVATIPLAWHLGLFVLEPRALLNILVAAFGWLVSHYYGALKLRNGLWIEEQNNHVGEQIRREILSMIPADLEVTAEEREHLSKNWVIKKIYGIFWEAVDSHPQLKDHKESFYEIGKYYSTAFDVFIIWGSAGYFYLFGLYFGNDWFYLYVSLAFLTAATVSWYYIIPNLRKQMLELSMEQLGQIKRLQRDFVSKAFRDAVKDMRSENLHITD